MKKTFILPVLLLVTLSAFSQQPVMVSNPFPKTITVTGSAEMEVVPDEIYVNIVLREYQNKGESKKNLETIKSDFLNAAKNAGIADSLITIASYTGSNNYMWRKKKKDPDLMASIAYQVKFRSSAVMDLLVDKLDDEATQSFMIVRVSHSKLNEYRKQLKIAAVKAARDKALYLTAAVEEKLGHAITIEEPREPQFLSPQDPGIYGLKMRGVNTNLESYEQAGGNIDFRKIKLHFDVSVIYALQ